MFVLPVDQGDRHRDLSFGLTGLPAASEAEAIDAETNAMLDVYDAISDFALAEGVHQVVQGNFDRIGAMLNAYSSGTSHRSGKSRRPPGGIGLTHRAAALFPFLASARFSRRATP